MGENSFEKALRKLEEQKRKQVVVNKGGIDALGLLGVGLVLLKATDNIDWSWVWVLAPFWIPLGIALVVIALLVIVAIIVAVKGGNVTVSKDEDENAGDNAETPKTVPVPIIIGIVHEPGEVTPTDEVHKPKPKKKPKKNTTNGDTDTTRQEPESPEGTEAPNN